MGQFLQLIVSLCSSYTIVFVPFPEYNKQVKAL